MKKHILALILGSASLLAAESGQIGVVNFATCMEESKLGKKEHENMESLRKQMVSLMEKTEKEIKEIATKFEDTEFLDSLSPKAEEELKMKHQALQEDMGRYQNQYYQVMQQAHYQVMQKMQHQIAKVAETLAQTQDKKLDYILNKEACFYIRPDLDLTKAIIVEMDKAYDVAAKDKKVSENAEAPVSEAPKAG